jgi:hypothetical protein
MANQPSPQSTFTNAEMPTSHLVQEYEETQKIYRHQSPLVQNFIETQARQLADAIVQHLPQMRFTLPDRVVTDADPDSSKAQRVPENSREQMIGGVLDRLTRSDSRVALRVRFTELEQSSNKSVAVGARLVRHATVMHMVHNMLPSGRTVEYAAIEGEEIATMPKMDDLEPESAITATTDAIALEEGKDSAGRGELQVPFVPAARRFYLPQWVAFDNKDALLVGGLNEAQAHLNSMQNYVWILHAAVALAPYMVTDSDYQQKRYGMLGQLVNQGRALARYQTREIIQTIQRRAAAHSLNRGLSLSLPYFDDQDLQMKNHDFEVIPAGRIMFVPAFVVRAARQERVKVAQDTRLDMSTRKYLLAELKMLEEAFETSEDED